MVKVLFTTIWKGKSIEKLLKNYNFDKIVFLKDILHGQKKQNEIILKIIEKNKDIREIEETNIGVYDIYQITKEISKLIKNHKNDDIYFNITEGRKTQILGIQLAISLNKSLVKDTFYLTEEEDEPINIITLPILGVEKLTPTETKVLIELENKQLKAKQIALNLGVNDLYVFRVLKTLVKKRYIENIKGEYKITKSGLILLIGWNDVKAQ